MTKTLPGFETPKGSTRLWRYSGFAHFVWMLHVRALHFGRADRFEDQFEGLLPLRASQRWRALAKRLGEQRVRTYVSCWHANEYESVGMWKAFTLEPGIAIETTASRLRTSLDAHPETIYLASVRYIDFDAEHLGAWEKRPRAIDPILHKRRQFDFEREVRAVIDPSSKSSEHAARAEETSVVVPVDLSALILRVHTSPGAEEWFVDLVSEMLDRFDVRVAVERSRLDEVPGS